MTGAHVEMEGENQLQEAVLWPLRMCYGHTYSNNKYIHFEKDYWFTTGFSNNIVIFIYISNFENNFIFTYSSSCQSITLIWDFLFDKYSSAN